MEGSSFEWGKTDCASLTRAALAQMFGVEVFPSLPQWSTAREALTVLHEHGTVGSILEKAGAICTTRAYLRAGDIIVTQEPEEEVGRTALLVCIDEAWCLAGGRKGVQLVPPPAYLDFDERCVYSLWEIADRG